MNCPNCQNPVSADDLYCGKCGRPLDGQSNAKQTFATIQDTKIVGEGRNFFKNVFVSHDKEILSDHKYSYLLSLSLIAIPLILLSIIVMFIGNDVPAFPIIKKIFVLAFMIIGGTTGLIYGLLHLFTASKISYQKILSDYILLNTFSIISLMLGALFFRMGAEPIGMFFMLLFFLVFLVLPLYILTKYISQQKTSIASYYLILTFIVCQTLLTMMVAESVAIFIAQLAASAVQNQLNY